MLMMYIYPNKETIIIREKFYDHTLRTNHKTYENPTYYRQMFHPDKHTYYDDSYKYGLIGRNKYNYVSLNQAYFNTYVDEFKYSGKCDQALRSNQRDRYKHYQTKPYNMDLSMIKDHQYQTDNQKTI